MKRRCPVCDFDTISQYRLALFLRQKCCKCGWRIGFTLGFEVMFHFFTTTPIALLVLFLTFSRGVAFGLVAGVGVFAALAYLAARMGPLGVRGLRQ